MAAPKTKIFTVLPAVSESIKSSNENNIRKAKVVHGNNLYRSGFSQILKGQQSLNHATLETKDDDTKYIYGIFGPIALIISISSCFTVTLLPAHNVLTSPEYWYEIIMPTSTHCLFAATLITIYLKIALNPFNKSTIMVAIDLFSCAMIAQIFGYSIIHIIWTTTLGYFEPFPGRQLIVAYLFLFAIYARIWKVFSLEKRGDPKFERRCKFSVLHGLWRIFITFLLVVMSGILEITYDNYRDIQCLIVLIVPLTKEINDRISDYIVTKYANPDTLVQAKLNGRINNNVAYSFWMAISLATRSTAASGTSGNRVSFE